jgi:hypothetical protein
MPNRKSRCFPSIDDAKLEIASETVEFNAQIVRLSRIKISVVGRARHRRHRIADGDPRMVQIVKNNAARRLHQISHSLRL